MMLDKPLTTITEADLQALIDQQEVEGKYLDYKSMLNLKEPKAKDELRRDVTAFANAGGGTLIIGVPDKDGVPQHLSGWSLDGASIEQLHMQLTQILRSRITPRLQGLDMRTLTLATGQNVTLLRIAKSFFAPHQVENESNSYEFWVRVGPSKQRMDVTDLRRAFAATAAATDQIGLWRMERLSKIVSGEITIPLASLPHFVLHLIPLGTLSNDGDTRDIRVLRGTGLIQAGLMREPGAGTYNFDGLYVPYPQHRLPTLGYTQVFWNGRMEIVDSPVQMKDDESYCINPKHIHETLHRTLLHYTRTYTDKLEAMLPFFVVASFVNIRGYSLVLPLSVMLDINRPSVPLGIDQMLFPEFLIESEAALEDIATLIEQRMWYGFGYEHPLYER